MQHLVDCVNSLAFSSSIWWPQLRFEMPQRPLHTRLAGYGIPGLYKPPRMCRGWHREGAGQGLHLVGCPAHPSSCCELHSGLCFPHIGRNVCPCVLHPGRNQTSFQFILEVENLVQIRCWKKLLGRWDVLWGQDSLAEKNVNVPFVWTIRN